jgi:predicted transcriptional regulator
VLFVRQWLYLPVEDLRKNPGYWFIPIITENENLETVIDEEAVWRFIDNEISENKEDYDKILEKTVADVLEYVEGVEDLKKIALKAYVQVTMDQSVSDAMDLMDEKNVSLAIAMDNSGIPTGFITTKDVRKALFQAD